MCKQLHVTTVHVPKEGPWAVHLTLYWAKIGDGPILFKVSVLNAKERPGKLPTKRGIKLGLVLQLFDTFNTYMYLINQLRFKGSYTWAHIRVNIRP